MGGLCSNPPMASHLILGKNQGYYNGLHDPAPSDTPPPTCPLSSFPTALSFLQPCQPPPYSSLRVFTQIFSLLRKTFLQIPAKPHPSLPSGLVSNVFSETFHGQPISHCSHLSGYSFSLFSALFFSIALSTVWQTILFTLCTIYPPH